MALLKRLTSLAGNSLEDVTVELLLPVSKELANHLPTQALPLEQEVGHAHRSVRNKVPFDQILNSLLWFPAETHEGEGERQRELQRKNTNKQMKRGCSPSPNP